MTSKRLSIDIWTDQGLKALLKCGPDALRAEPLARSIGTTKGSFYWHFADVPAFQTAVLKRWQTDAFAQIVDQLSTTGNAETRLRAFGETLCKNKTDPAIRAWAQADKKVAKALAQVDEQRLQYITRLLNSLGVANPAFAVACYATLCAAPNLTKDTTQQLAFDALIDLVLALK